MASNSPTSDKTRSVHEAVRAMRDNRPLRAEEICRDFLNVNPGSVEHQRVLAHALMKQQRLDEAARLLEQALDSEPDNPHLCEDLGSVLALQSRFEDAVPLLEKAIRLEPRLPLAHKKLGQALAMLGRGEEADEAFESWFERDPERGLVAEGAAHLKAGRRDDAIRSFKDALRDNPDNVDALRFLANSYLQEKENLADAEALLKRATQVAPDFAAAWMLLGAVLHERSRHVDSVGAYQKVTELEAGNAIAWGALGNAFAYASEPQKAAAAYARSIELQPDSPSLQMGYAHVLKTLGDQPASLAAYRAAVKHKPDFGEVYWSMANLKVFRFEEHEVADMERQLENPELSESAEVHFRFALGKACEDLRDYDRAWHYYDSGNRKQRMRVSHDPSTMEIRQSEIREVFSREFLEQNAGHGDPSPGPIFILGMPRSGSTLVEQILASHSQVEGTSELPYLSHIAASIGRYRPDNLQYPKSALDLRRKDWRAYGQQYMEETRRHRQTDSPRFSDKLPNNFPHVGLLHLILPNATVINARRHPLDTCLGNYKQLFGRGQNFTYDIEDLADYYREYHDTMQHWHAVLPGKVLDVHYEETVLDLEGQVRRILEHCGLPFEQACVEYHKTERAVQTASSEQVRQPIYRGALGKWRRYDRHLEIWKEELADIIEALPEAVRNAGR